MDWNFHAILHLVLVIQDSFQALLDSMQKSRGALVVVGGIEPLPGLSQDPGLVCVLVEVGAVSRVVLVTEQIG